MNVQYALRFLCFHCCNHTVPTSCRTAHGSGITAERVHAWLFAGRAVRTIWAHTEAVHAWKDGAGTDLESIHATQRIARCDQTSNVVFGQINHYPGTIFLFLLFRLETWCIVADPLRERLGRARKCWIGAPSSRQVNSKARMSFAWRERHKAGHSIKNTAAEHYMPNAISDLASA